MKLLRGESPSDSVLARSMEDAEQFVSAERWAMDADRTALADRRSGKERVDDRRIVSGIAPNTSNRIRSFSFNKTAYKQRHRIENAFCRLKAFRRIFTRCDRLARDFLASVCLAAAIVWRT